MLSKFLIDFTNRHPIELVGVFLLLGSAVLGGALHFIPMLSFLAGFLHPGVILGFIPVFIGFAILTDILMYRAASETAEKEDELERIERLKAPARKALGEYCEAMEKNARLEESYQR